MKNSGFKYISKKKVRVITFTFSVFFIIVVSISTGVTHFIESNDKFCASCHTQPETTYYQRSIEKTSSDLATYHAKKNIDCIDCHSKPWFTGRIISQFQAFNNYLVHRAGEGKKFNKSRSLTGNENCTKCHSNSMWSTERSGHHHSPVMQQKWQAKGGPLQTCESCHNSHGKTRRLPGKLLLTSNNIRVTRIKNLPSMKKSHVLNQCQSCHKVLDKEKEIHLEYFK